MQLLAVVLTMVSLMAAPEQRAAAPSLAGKWLGAVTTDIGQMNIALTITVEKNVASGTIETGHGAFQITKGTVTDGKWTLPFASPDGATGKMIGVLKGDQFAGDWDFRPIAVGTFAVERAK